MRGSRIVVIAELVDAESLDRFVQSISAWPGVTASWADPARRQLRLSGWDAMIESVISAGVEGGFFEAPVEGEA